ncbi:LytR/AlgR family response regulator transcription factor [Mongoliitalea daihaiensis]|uniref:LytR/AlgR family response regulator transcription factor n=1 Tax=Mongoliitalea daihaiensis TaxID=2782006 RepID=UPI001F3E3A20|nr:LytTR family DNA-binding domain-containing protein [Mongoliitalea daihaiensis]UJP66696.1 response regulator transcription factor [Mongoliitalea daihaiensis]
MKIDVLIIEDELPARRKLLRYLGQLQEEVQVVAECATVEEAISFFEAGGKVDLILSDIALLDGNAFDIYQEIALKSPIIFTTAYADYTMNAFESNGIDYLMKPFTFERFEKAWKKYVLFAKQNLTSQASNLSGFKTRFVINTPRDSYFLEVEDIAYFLAEEGVVKAVDLKGKTHLMGLITLKELEEKVDPSMFFRINRAELVHKKGILRMERYGKNNLAIQMQGSEKKLITSQANTSAFREWVEK